MEKRSQLGMEDPVTYRQIYMGTRNHLHQLLPVRTPEPGEHAWDDLSNVYAHTGSDHFVHYKEDQLEHHKQTKGTV